MPQAYSTDGDSHLLNLRVLASEDPKDYALLLFEGREAISQPYEYRVEILAPAIPNDLASWIGKPLEFSVALTNNDTRIFAGRIYEAEVLTGVHGPTRILLVARPAFWATSYTRGTHFMQDQNTLDIFKAVTQGVPGLVTDVSADTPPVRPYITRYDESEFDFLTRLFAQDGLFYFFTYDSSSGPYAHKMHIGSSAAAYLDVPNQGKANFTPGSDSSTFKAYSSHFGAVAGTRHYHAFDVNKLDTPFRAASKVTGEGSVYANPHEEFGATSTDAGALGTRGTRHAEGVSRHIRKISGTSDDPSFFAGGRITTDFDEAGVPARMVFASVSHSAYDPSALGQGGTPHYSNQFVAVDASEVMHPPAPSERRRAYGPVMGVVKEKSAPDGKVVVDQQSRIPVVVSRAVDSDASKPFDPTVWMPVQQAWAHSTHGVQFFPRTGQIVIVDFLYGDPDMPFVAGTMYTPSAKFPFDPQSKATQTGWRSKTDENGSITQELIFEDKPGAEEIYLYTGRDYRRVVDHDEKGTIKHDRDIHVQNDHREKVDRNQSVRIGANRTLAVSGAQKTDITKTRTVTVTKKSKLESMEEIELKVGLSSIVLTETDIKITAPFITIKADAELNMSAGVMANLKGIMTEISGDAILTLKGGLVMIN